MIEREETNPTLVNDRIFTSAFELGFLGVLEEDGLFRIGDQVVVGLATAVRAGDKERTGRPTIITPLGRPVVPLE